MKEENLKPCPFCGSNLIKTCQQGHTEFYTVLCADCGTWANKFLNENSPMTKNQAIKRWNTRVEA